MIVAMVAASALGVACTTATKPAPGRIGPSLGITANGRHLAPAGRLTTVGNFPTGGALSPDGRFYWAVDCGHGRNDVQTVRIADGTVVQMLPLPGAYGGIAFDGSGRHAYVSGEPRGTTAPVGPTRGDQGDVLHVFTVDPATGRAEEQDPFVLPPTSGGTAQLLGGAGWPQGLAITPDGRRIVVALNQADQVAVVDTVARTSRLVRVGRYPSGVATSPDGRTAYVSNEYDGTISFVDLRTDTKVFDVGVGGPLGNRNAHPEGLVVDPSGQQVFVAVTNRDLVAIVDTAARRVLPPVSVGRTEGLGAAPVAVALAPDGRTVYSADSGEDAVAVISLPRGPAGPATLVGRIPTAAYTSDVHVTPDGQQLLWLAAKGLGAGPNPDYGEHWANSNAAPYGSYVVDKLIGRVGMLPVPTMTELQRLTRVADREVTPVGGRPAPTDSPVLGPAGSPSTRIRHIFYVVRENRTYDQIFGTERRGDGDPGLELVDDNGVPGPAGGVTPNAHQLARIFPLLDHVYANSEVSKDGHVITSSGYATDFVQKALHADYAGRGRKDYSGVAPVSFPPEHFLFDQAVRQHLSFRNYGENGAGTSPFSNDGRPTYALSVAGQDTSYPGRFGCDRIPYRVPTTATPTPASPALGAIQRVAASITIRSSSTGRSPAARCPR